MSKDKQAAPFAVGDKVMVTDVNFPTQEGTVTKVGRVLVTVECGCGYPQQFRIEGRYANDTYQHQDVYTLSEWDARQRKADALNALAEYGLTYSTDSTTKRLSLGVLEGIVKFLGDNYTDEEEKR